MFCNLHIVEDHFSWEVGWTGWTSIPLSTRYSFPNRHTYVYSVQYCLFSCFEQFCWGLIRTCWLFDLLSITYGTSNLWTKFSALVPNIFVQFLPLLHRGTSLHNTLSLSAICLAASVKFSHVADWIYCRRGWNSRVIDLTICKCCLEFPFEFAAFNSTLMPSSYADVFPLWAFSAFSSWYWFLSFTFSSLFPWLLQKSHQISRTINRKNNSETVFVAFVTVLTLNVAEKQIYFDAWTQESKVNLALMGLSLRK